MYRTWVPKKNLRFMNRTWTLLRLASTVRYQFMHLCHLWGDLDHEVLSIRLVSKFHSNNIVLRMSRNSTGGSDDPPRVIEITVSNSKLSSWNIELFHCTDNIRRFFFRSPLCNIKGVCYNRIPYCFKQIIFRMEDKLCT